MQTDTPRVRQWLARPGGLLAPVDHPAFDRMAEALLDALSAAGGPERNYEKYVALLKAMAATMAPFTMDETPETIAELCGALGAEVFVQIETFRSALTRDTAKRSHAHG